MKNLMILLACLFLAGCAAFSGNRTAEVEKRVKTLGVLPVIVDGATFDYSNRDGLLALIEATGGDVDNWLVEDLRASGGYFDVRLIDVSAEQLAGQILSGRSLVGEGAERHPVYAYSSAGIGDLVSANLVDAVLVVVISEIVRPEKRWSEYATNFENLETDYRSLVCSAAVVAAPAEILWTRPVTPGDVFLRLDYPDFLEAYWNRTDTVTVKEITLPGLQRTLAEPEKGLFVKTDRTKLYGAIVRELANSLKNGL